MVDPFIRLLCADDSFAELTQLLHRAYAPLAARGLHFLASHQDEDWTRKRIARGECYVAFHGQQMIGTIVWRNAQQTRGCPWYEFYTKRGYRFIEHVKWDLVNYRSVVMSKRIGTA